MDPDVDDAYLVQRAQQGYLDAYTELVNRHSALTYRVALRLLGDHEDAQDVAQEALVTAWEKLPEFRAGSAFSTWLYAIVTRKALNRMTRTKRTDPLDLLGDVADSDVDGPGRREERRQTVDAVTDAVTALPPAQRIAIVLHHFEGLSNADVARITGSTVPAVTGHLYRARRTLLKTLAEWK